MERRSSAECNVHPLAGSLRRSADVETEIDGRHPRAVRKGRREGGPGGGHLLHGWHAREPDVLGREISRPARTRLRRFVAGLVAKLREPRRPLTGPRRHESTKTHETLFVQRILRAFVPSCFPGPVT